LALRAVLFDAVGTLFELREPVGVCYSRAAAARGVTLSGARLEDAFARYLRAADPAPGAPGGPEALPENERAWWRGVVRGTFRSADATLRFPDFEALFADLWDHFGKPAAWRLREGVAAGLDSLASADLGIAIVSNFDHRLPALLEGLGLLAKLECVVLPSSCGARKPDPLPFRAALDALEVPAADCVYVGNDPALDLDAARATGIAAVDVEALDFGPELGATIQAAATLAVR
jgi:putative hydrolase of the HAD superfamily